MNNDLSDEARDEWCKRFRSSIRLTVAQNTWQECKRRAEARLALIDEAALATATTMRRMAQKIVDLQAIIEEYIGERQHLEAELFNALRLIEERERKAFSANFIGSDKDLFLAYGAYQEGSK